VSRAGPALWGLVALLAPSCRGSLLSDEPVLGEDLAAASVVGEAGSRLGASVAVGLLDGQLTVAVAAPDLGQVLVLDPDGGLRWQVQGTLGLGHGLVITDQGLWALQPGVGVVALRAEDAGADALPVIEELPQAAQVAVCADGTVRSSPSPAEALACGPSGEDLRTRCGDTDCEVLLDGVVLDRTSPGSAVGFDSAVAPAVACWGDTELPVDDAPGEVRCADGRRLVGLDGEHLGRSLAPGWATGVFDKWIVPARARIHSLDGSRVLAVDRAAEATRLALASGEGLLVVGVPGYAARDPGEGRVFILDDTTEALP